MAKHFSLRNRRICDKWVELSLKSSKSPNEEISLIKKTIIRISEECKVSSKGNKKNRW